MKAKGKQAKNLSPEMIRALVWMRAELDETARATGMRQKALWRECGGISRATMIALIRRNLVRAPCYDAVISPSLGTVWLTPAGRSLAETLEQ